MVQQEALIKVDFRGITKKQTNPIEINMKKEDDKCHNVEDKDKKINRDSLINRVIDI